MGSINIQRNQLTKEQDSTPQKPTDSDNNESLQESYYELLRVPPPKKNFFRHPTNSFFEHIQHTRKSPQKIFSCNDQKQPLLDEDISNHIQFDQERNLSYLPTLKRKRHIYANGLRKYHS